MGVSNIELIKQRFCDSINVKSAVIADDVLLNNVSRAAELIVCAFKSGGKLLVCGNGGSASDALHFAGELVGRFEKERSPWPVICLNSDVSTITSISNDYGYNEVFSRQVNAFASTQDVLIGISTSGNSKNVISAIVAAREKGIKTIGLLGKDGGCISNMVDISIVVPSGITARIQESHITIIHILCELIESSLCVE